MRPVVQRSMTVEKTFIVAADAPCVQGHFTGAPVVPGAWLLGRAHAHLLAAYPERAVASIKKAKFPAPLLPGEAVAVTMDDSRWPRLKLTFTTAKAKVLEAQVVMNEA